MTDLTVYEIPSHNMPGLQAKIEKLSRRSVKLIGKPVVLNMIAEVQKPAYNARGTFLMIDGKQVFDTYFQVSINAETPKINGWTFVATIDHSNDGGNIIRVSPNTNYTPDEKYRLVGPVCDHCGKIRSRRDTFLLREDATGNIKQIGRQCIRDFIGYDVEQVVAMAEINQACAPSDSDGDDYRGMSDHRTVFVRTFLAHVSCCIREYGWISNAQARSEAKTSTSNAASENMFRRPDNHFSPKRLIAEDFSSAAAALEYGLALTGKNDYEYTLNLLCKQTLVEHRSCGFLASLIPAYFRAKEREFAAQQRREAMNLNDSQFVGTIGERLKKIECTLYAANSVSTEWGASMIYSFLTKDGNTLTWFSTQGVEGLGGLAATNRQKVLVTGRVKDHVIYKDVKQTKLTRCLVEIVNGVC